MPYQSVKAARQHTPYQYVRAAHLRAVPMAPSAGWDVRDDVRLGLGRVGRRERETGGESRDGLQLLLTRREAVDLR